MKKRLVLFCLLFIFMLSSIAYAQSCEVSHVRNNLRKMLYEYFQSPSTATLELGKIKDLLDFYLQLPVGEETVDCTGIGQQSGISYEIIVQEADGITTVIPKCSDSTEFGSCSDSKPFYCYNGELVKRVDKCGSAENETLPPPAENQIPPVNETGCMDTDGGYNLYEKGTATGIHPTLGTETTKTDWCLPTGSVLDIIEISCNPTTGTVTWRDVPCPNNGTCTDGACSSECGNNICEEGIETCSNCEADCGSCPLAPVCGDNICQATESCSTCSQDCGSCPVPPPSNRCGDETCDVSELNTCPEDCSGLQENYHGVCEDNVCDINESCSTCSDCKSCGVCILRGGGVFEISAEDPDRSAPEDKYYYYSKTPIDGVYNRQDLVSVCTDEIYYSFLTDFCETYEPGGFKLKFETYSFMPNIYGDKYYTTVSHSHTCYEINGSALPTLYCGDGMCTGTEKCGCNVWGDYWDLHQQYRSISIDYPESFLNSIAGCSSCTSDCCSFDPIPAEEQINPVCGNDVCEWTTETCLTCPGDCGECPAVCGNEKCDLLENCAICPRDCGGECSWKDNSTCGNNICDAHETCMYCSADCGACPITFSQCADTDGPGNILKSGMAGNPGNKGIDSCSAWYPLYLGSPTMVGVEDWTCKAWKDGMGSVSGMDPVACPSGTTCVNGACVDRTGQCEPGWKCTDPNEFAYQDENCIWMENTAFICPSFLYCSGGECVEPICGNLFRDTTRETIENCPVDFLNRTG